MAHFDIKQLKYIKQIKHLLQCIIPPKIFDSIPIKLIRSWIFQGSLYMTFEEILFRYALEILLTALLYFFLVNVFYTWLTLLFSVIMIHTLSWLFNGHFWALAISKKRRLTVNKPEEIIAYIDNLYKRLAKTNSIKNCIVFGSLSRGEFTSNSDLDIIFTKNHGSLNTILAYIVGIRERSIAFLSCTPIELYFYNLNSFDRLDEKERPIVIKDADFEINKSIRNTIPYKNYPFKEQDFFNGTY